ncbi:MAG TPA: L,D-transpeptidase family protein [Chitinophagaceae bacterium]|nr:L,D-transpeptidase family protein [Chitinophagaceae bacterium]
MKYCFYLLIGSFLSFGIKAQTSSINLQVFGVKADLIREKVEDTLQKQFTEKGLKWPARYLFIRTYKYDKQLEVWVKNDWEEPFKLFKSYKVCITSGTIGPKRKEGDKQVPEGFYYINEFNPNSNYHLALGLNYPNSSDRMLSDVARRGGDIYIHGSCVSIGCIPLTDEVIEEVYVIAAASKARGQDFIPVHVYPVNFKVKKSFEYLRKFTEEPSYSSLAAQFKNAFYYFEEKRQLPVVMVNARGEYVVNAPEAKDNFYTEVRDSLNEDIAVKFGVADNVDRLPAFKEGNATFRNFLVSLEKDMAPLLPSGMHRIYLVVEFIIDKEGNTVHAQVTKGGAETINEKVIESFVNNCKWMPAIKENQPVASKLVQSLTIERPEED